TVLVLLIPAARLAGAVVLVLATARLARTLVPIGIAAPNACGGLVVRRGHVHHVIVIGRRLDREGVATVLAADTLALLGVCDRVTVFTRWALGLDRHRTASFP